MYCEINEETKVGNLVFNRAPLNLFTLGVFAEFDAMVTELEDCVNRDEVRCIVLSSAFEKAFSAGDDVKGGPETADEGVRENDIARSVMARIRNFPAPTIAAVDGYAMGGGAVLAYHCDYRISTDRAVYGLAEILFGMVPNWGSTLLLGRTCKLPLLKKLLFTGERFDVQTAKELDIIQEIVAPEDLLPTAFALAEKFAANAPIGVRGTKALLNAAADGISDSGHYHLETSYTRVTFDSEDTVEGVKAFSEKRKPVFKNK